MSNPSEKENSIKNPYVMRKIMTPSIKPNTSLSLLNRSNNNVSTVMINKPSLSTSKFQLMRQGLKRDNRDVRDIKEIKFRFKPNTSKEKSVTDPASTILNNSTNNQNSSNKNVDISPNQVGTKTKRKFTELQKEKEEAKKATQPLIHEIEELNQELRLCRDSETEDLNFITKFKDFLNREGAINWVKIIPESLNAKGSCLLEYSPFYILYIKFYSKIYGESTGIKVSLPIEIFLDLIDNSLMYDQTDLKMIYHFFIDFLNQNYKKEEMMIVLKRKAYQTVSIDDLSELNETYYKYLLSKPESFLKFELDAQRNSIHLRDINSKKKKFAFRLNKRDSKEQISHAEVISIKENSVEVLKNVNDNNDGIGNKNKTNLSDINERVEEININSPKKDRHNNIHKITHDMVAISASSFELNNPPSCVSFNNISEISNFSGVSKFSSDAQIFYNEIILRNKLELQIEKSHLNFAKKLNHNAKKLRKDKGSSFCILSEVKEDETVSNDESIDQQSDQKVAEDKVQKNEIIIINLNTDDSASLSKKNSKRSKSYSRKTVAVSSLKHKSVEEEEEEKTAEDIDPLRNTKKNTKVKNKKRYQSDKKSLSKRRKTLQKEPELPEEKEDELQKPTKKKETKAKVKEDQHRGRSSDSNTVSAKESEVEEVTVKKKSSKSINKLRIRSKTNKRKSKK